MKNRLTHKGSCLGGGSRLVVGVNAVSKRNLWFALAIGDMMRAACFRKGDNATSPGRDDLIRTELGAGAENHAAQS